MDTAARPARSPRAMTPPPDAVVRAARPADAEALLRVLCAAFGMDADAARPLFYADPFYDLSHKRVLVCAPAGVVSCLTVLPATLLLGGAAIPAGGIAGVATLPAHQGRGYASRLLTSTIHALADELKYPLCALFPVSDDYYRRLGWETASRAACWTGTLPGTGEIAPNSHVRRTAPQDFPAIRGLHEAASPAQTGLCRRDPRRWRVLETMTPTWEWSLFTHNNIPTGYAAWERSEAVDSPARIHELITLTPEARRALLSFLAREGGAQTMWQWIRAPSDAQPMGAPPPDARVTAAPGMMLRITDLLAAMRCLHPAFAPVLAQAGRALTVLAADPQRPGNERPVRLTASGVVPGRTADREWIRASIGALAQFYTGYVLPSELAERGALQASSSDALSLADQCFPLRDSFIAPADQF